MLVSKFIPITKKQWEEQLRIFNYCCAYCLKPNPNLEMEHMHPLSREGEHTIENLVPACKSCNSKKSNRTLVEFIQQNYLSL